MNNLQLLDVICYETDHHPNNYMVIFDDDGAAVGISSFDNNSESSFRYRRDIFAQSNKKTSLLVDRRGKINRPYFDRCTIERLNRIRFLDLFRALRDCLSFASILFTWMRIATLRKILKTAMRDHPERFLAPEDWNAETICEELSGAYGKTYLQSFLDDCLAPIEFSALKPKEQITAARAFSRYERLRNNSPLKTENAERK